MRRNQHIRRRPQLIINRQRLRIRYIERSAANQVAMQCLYKRSLINDLSPRNIRHIRAPRIRFMEQFEFSGREEVSRCFGQRHSNDEKIELLLQELVHVVFAGAAVPRAGEGAVWVAGAGHNVTVIAFGFRGFAGRGCVREDVHAHGFCHAGDCGGVVSDYILKVECAREVWEGRWAARGCSGIVPRESGRSPGEVLVVE
jgi:hypothetical protein